MLPYAYHPQMLVPTPSELLGAIAPPPPPIPRRAPPEPTANRTETQRRARQRAVAEEIGFVPTDPYVLDHFAAIILTPHRSHSATPSHPTKRNATIWNASSITSSTCTSSSGSSRYPRWPSNGSRPTGVSPHAASAHSWSTCRTSTRPSTKTSWQRNRWLVFTPLLSLSPCLRLPQFLDLSADVKAAHSPGIPQRSHSADVVATSDYTPLPHQAFLGPDGATYQCLDDPHASIPAGYFGSL